VRVGYQQREGRREYILNTSQDLMLGSLLLLASGGESSYKEFQVTARYKFRQAD
jgi:hypothetical protein